KPALRVEIQSVDRAGERDIAGHFAALLHVEQPQPALVLQTDGQHGAVEREAERRDRLRDAADAALRAALSIEEVEGVVAERAGPAGQHDLFTVRGDGIQGALVRGTDWGAKNPLRRQLVARPDPRRLVVRNGDE